MLVHFSNLHLFLLVTYNFAFASKAYNTYAHLHLLPAEVIVLAGIILLYCISKAVLKQLKVLKQCSSVFGTSFVLSALDVMIAEYLKVGLVVSTNNFYSCMVM